MMSVQNVCDSSRLRTFRTRWFRPTGVTALFAMSTFPFASVNSISIERLGSNGHAAARPATDWTTRLCSSVRVRDPERPPILIEHPCGATWPRAQRRYLPSQFRRPERRVLHELDQMKDEELGYPDPRPWHHDTPQRPKTWDRKISPI